MFFSISAILYTHIVQVQQLLCRAPLCVAARLGELLSCLAVLARLHRDARAAPSLVAANLPLLSFTQVIHAEADARDSVHETSESEMSEGDPGHGAADSGYQRRKMENLIQKEALHILNLIAKRIPKKEVVAFWFVFLPDKSFSPLSGSVTELISHQNKRIRIQALSIMADFLNHIGPFLSLAQHSQKPTSYTSLSSALSSSVSGLHAAVLSRLGHQLGPTELVALLKLVSLLAEHCPYSKLEASLLDTVITACLDLAQAERNPVIQVAILSVFSSLCQHKASEAALVRSVGVMFGFMVARARPDKVSLYPDNNVRYMALQALAGLTNLDINTFIKNAPEVKKLIDISLQDTDASVVLHAFRFIKNFAKNLTILVETESKQSETDSKVSNLAIAFWVDFLKQPNFQLLDKFPNANIKSAFCDCLAEMGGHIYSELPQPKKLVCVSYILSQCALQEDSQGLSLDRQIQDRAALSSSLRTLGIMVMFPTYLTDTAFHVDVADAVLPHLPTSKPQAKSDTKALDPSNKAVKISASWALANLTDTLVQADATISDCEEKFPVIIAKKILYAAVASARDGGSAVNTQSNAVRCVGNMLYYLHTERLGLDTGAGDSAISDGVDCITTLINTGKIMKIRWNACYAAGNVLKKTDIDADFSWKRSLVDCLLDAVRNHQNFKVRINAAYALGCPVRRESLGEQYVEVVGALVDSLATTHSDQVAGEWTHMENLRDQIVLSLCQLLALCKDAKEFCQLCTTLSNNYDLFETSLKMSIKRISPEKCSPFLTVSERAEDLSKGSHGSREEVVMINQVLKQLVLEWGL